MKRSEETIFDIGMHEGQDTKHYLSRGYKVIAVEANPILAAAGRKKFSKEIKSGQLQIINKGIAATEGEMPFYINKRLTEWSSFDKELGTRSGNYEVQTVDCIATSGLFETFGIPHYLKVDIEGFDHYCINDIPPNGAGPNYVSCEATEVSLLDAMYEKGYRKFKLIHQSNGFKVMDLRLETNRLYLQWLTIRNGIFLRLNPYISFKHPYGSSGPFGEATDGNWISFEEAREQFQTFYQHEQNTPLNATSWFDFHGSF